MAKTMTGKRLTVALPADLVKPLERLAEQEDRSLSAQIVNIVRRHLQAKEDWELLDEAIASADRGEAFVLREGAIRATRQAILDGKSTDEVMEEFTRGSVPSNEYWAKRRREHPAQQGAQHAG